MVKHLKAATALLLTLLLVLSAGMVGINPHLSAQDEVTALAAVNTEEEWDLVKQQHQVSTVSPSNATINLFDYWATPNRTDPDGDDSNGDGLTEGNTPSDFYNQQINAGHLLVFRRQGNVGAYGRWNQSFLQGIVQSQLGSDGFPHLQIDLEESLANNEGTRLEGRPSDESLQYLFDPAYPFSFPAFPRASCLCHFSVFFFHAVSFSLSLCCP